MKERSMLLTVSVLSALLLLFAGCADPEANSPISDFSADFISQTDDDGFTEGTVEVSWTDTGNYRTVEVLYWGAGIPEPGSPQITNVSESRESAIIKPATGFGSTVGFNEDGTLNIKVVTKSYGDFLGEEELTVEVEKNKYPRKPELKVWEAFNQDPDKVVYDWFLHSGAQPDSLYMYWKRGNGDFERLGGNYDTGHTDPESTEVPAGSVGDVFTFYMEATYGTDTVKSDDASLEIQNLEQAVEERTVTTPVLSSFELEDKDDHWEIVATYNRADYNDEYATAVYANFAFKYSHYPTQFFRRKIKSDGSTDTTNLMIMKDDLDYNVSYDVELYLTAEYGSLVEESETLTKTDYVSPLD